MYIHVYKKKYEALANCSKECYPTVKAVYPTSLKITNIPKRIMKEDQLQISSITLYRSSNLSINAIASRNFFTGFSVQCHEGLQWDSACRSLFARLENRLTDLSIVRVLDVYPRRHPGSIDPRDRGCAPGAGKCRGVHDRDKSTRWSPYRLEEVTGRF